MASTRRVVFGVAAAAILAAAAAGAAYLYTGAPLALRLLWLAGPIALTAAGFALLQLLLPRDDR